MTMGTGWRRFSEKAKQKWHLTLDRSFPATVNLRNEAMMKEAGEFASHLRRCEKDIRALKNATEGLLMTTKVVLSAPLPRVYEEMGNGRVGPAPASAEQGGNLIGGDFKVEDLTRVSRETARKLDTEVLAPMGRWNTAFHTVEMRMKKLEEIRLEVDSRRRTVQELQVKVEKQRDRLPQTRAKGEDEMNNTIKIQQHKENKLAAARQSFKEHEALVYQQLAQLIRDGVWLKSYIAAVMRVEQEAFTTAYNAMGPSRSAVGMSASMADGVSAASHEAPGPMINASRENNQSQALSPASAMMRQVVSKMARKQQQGGKENSGVFDAPSAPTHRITANASTVSASRYDRYGEATAYGNHGNQQVPAWQ